MAGNVRIRGRMYSYSDVVIQLDGVPLTTVTDISYEETPAFENVYGAGSEPIGLGRGNTEYTASITIKQDELKTLVRSAPGGKLSNIPLFDVIVSYLGEDPFTNVLKSAKIAGTSLSTSDGDTSIGVTVDLLIAGIDWTA